jgi:hypothetical protein
VLSPIQQTGSNTQNHPRDIDDRIDTINIDLVIQNSRKLNDTLILGSLYVGLDETAGKDLQIIDFLTFFRGEKMDVICLQGFHKFSVIKDFIRKLEKIVDKDFPHMHLYYAPQVPITTPDQNSFDVTWSSSGDCEDSAIDCLIISMHPILHFGKIKFEEHLDLVNSSKYIIMANINYKGTLVSVYSASLQEDLAGIKNTTLRRRQLDQLNRVIQNNKMDMQTHSAVDEVQNQGIHIVCGNFNINEIDNDVISKEYIHAFRNFKFIDAYRYVLKCKNIKTEHIDDATNISGFRTSYIVVSVENIDPGSEDITVDYITKYLLNNYGILIVNSKIKQLQGFENYVVESSFKIRKMESASFPMGNPVNTALNNNTTEEV